MVTSETGKASSYDDIPRRPLDHAKLVNSTGGFPPPPGGFPPAILTPNFPPPGKEDKCMGVRASEK